jgi:hypothetical protein
MNTAQRAKFRPNLLMGAVLAPIEMDSCHVKIFHKSLPTNKNAVQYPPWRRPLKSKILQALLAAIDAPLCRAATQTSRNRSAVLSNSTPKLSAFPVRRTDSAAESVIR